MRLVAFLVLCDCGRHQDKYQNRRDRFERADKQAAEQACRQAQLRGNRTDYDTQRQTGGNLPDQADAADRMK